MPTETDTCISSKNECYTFLHDDLVVRGCVNDEQQTNIVKCSSRLYCNDQKIEIERCFSQAYGSDDVKSKQCPLAIAPLGCYHYGSPVSTIKGCISELTNSEREYSLKRIKYFKICTNGDNCNSRHSLLSCLSCTSANNSDCISDANSIAPEFCDDYNDVCFARITNENLFERGCLANASEDAIKDCSSNEAKCKTCDREDMCNNHNVTDVCVSCSSETDENCRNNIKNVTNRVLCDLDTPSNKSKPLGCYLKIKDDVVTRGCVQDLDSKDLEECTSPDINYCQICRGKNCNEKVGFHQTCHTCIGSFDHGCSYPNRFDLDDPYPYTLKCQNYASSCLIGIDEQGYTNRDCGDIAYNGYLDVARYGEGMEFCYEDKCNDYVYPSNRHLCYQCKNCASLNIKENKPNPCRIYSEDDHQCYTIAHEGIIFLVFLFSLFNEFAI